MSAGKQTAANVNTPWMTARQAAAYLAIALGTLRNLTSQRRIPFSKRCGIVRFHRAALVAWLSKGSCRGRADVADLKYSETEDDNPQFSANRD